LAKRIDNRQPTIAFFPRPKMRTLSNFEPCSAGDSIPVLTLRYLRWSSMRSASVTSPRSTAPGRKPSPRRMAPLLMSSGPPRRRMTRTTWPSPQGPRTPSSKTHSAHLHRWICTPQWPCRLGRPHHLPFLRRHSGNVGTGRYVCFGTSLALGAMRATSNTGELSAIYHALDWIRQR